MTHSIYYLLLVIGSYICAYRMMTSKNILSAALYLACVSAMTSSILYLLGATQVAVMELSVGAGLVTVLMVYAISVVGKDATDPAPIIPRIFSAVLCLGAIGMILWACLPLIPVGVSRTAQPLIMTLWQGRVLDIWIQVVLIFAGVMGILGLLAEQAVRKQDLPRINQTGN
jgi:uncharacterized MnhB-related membrane protein